ncbi:MAG: hypothetical protein F9K32_00585 [Desulfobulbaceae bacterium]|nr:MAG: hypothetical protein F9K32_00585 [Desulfobulbaceae bacterium]
MTFTTAQLRAIEQAIGRDAQVTVVVGGGSFDYMRFDCGPAYLEVSAMHGGQRVKSRVSVSPYSHIPVSHLAEKLVMDINCHIMREEFRRAF